MCYVTSSSEFFSIPIAKCCFRCCRNDGSRIWQWDGCGAERRRSRLVYYMSGVLYGNKCVFSPTHLCHRTTNLNILPFMVCKTIHGDMFSLVVQLKPDFMSPGMTMTCTSLCIMVIPMCGLMKSRFHRISKPNISPCMVYKTVHGDMFSFVSL